MGKSPGVEKEGRRVSEQKWVSEVRAWGQRGRAEDTGRGQEVRQERGLD